VSARRCHGERHPTRHHATRENAWLVDRTGRRNEARGAFCAAVDQRCTVPGNLAGTINPIIDQAISQRSPTPYTCWSAGSSRRPSPRRPPRGAAGRAIASGGELAGRVAGRQLVHSGWCPRPRSGLPTWTGSRAGRVAVRDPIRGRATLAGALYAERHGAEGRLRGTPARGCFPASAPHGRRVTAAADSAPQLLCPATATGAARPWCSPRLACRTSRTPSAPHRGAARGRRRSSASPCPR